MIINEFGCWLDREKFQPIDFFPTTPAAGVRLTPGIFVITSFTTRDSLMIKNLLPRYYVTKCCVNIAAPDLDGKNVNVVVQLKKLLKSTSGI